MSSSLKRLFTCAMTGIEQIRAGNYLDDSELGTFQNRITSDDPIHTFLLQSATAFVYNAAGAIPEKATFTIPVNAQEDQVPVCPEKAIHVLAKIFGDEFRELLGEFLQVLLDNNYRLPPHYLPSVFEQGSTPALRELIAASCGKRGLWLASQNPQWSWVGTTVIRTPDWETGTLAERLDYLKQQCRIEPQNAAALVTGVWNQESAETRVALLECLRDENVTCCEKLLDVALVDKRKEVRRAAIDSLCRIQESSFTKKLIAQISNHITFTPQKKNALQKLFGSKKNGFEIHLPETLDKEMERYGISQKLRQGESDFTGGEKAGWLFQMLELISPSVWLDTWSISAEELIDASKESEWNELLLESLTRASIRHREERWSAAILNHPWIKAHSNRYFSLLLPFQPQQVLESVFSSLLKDCATEQISLGMLLQLVLSEFKWTTQLSTSVISKLVPVLLHGTMQCSREISSIAIRINKDALDFGLQECSRFNEHEADYIPSMRRALAALIDTLTLRKRIYESFT
jgi:F0F1-type ATP synthase delta subunit